MAVCILGALAVSSCSKDEFFGLEDSEVLDYSTKYEIAMSQAYADYAIACYKIAGIMNQLSDSTTNKNIGEIDGKPFSYLESGESAMDLLDILKKAYPELVNADKPDLDEIQMIAFSKNEALKNLDIRLNTSTKMNGGFYESEWFIGTLDCEMTHYWTDYPTTNSVWIKKWYLEAFMDQMSAVSAAIWYSSEYGNQLGTGGLVFSDNSAACVVGIGEWPSLINAVSSAEVDFLIVPTQNINYLEALSLAQITGGGGRFHYFIHRNGEIVYSVW